MPLLLGLGHSNRPLEASPVVFISDIAAACQHYWYQQLFRKRRNVFSVCPQFIGFHPLSLLTQILRISHSVRNFAWQIFYDQICISRRLIKVWAYLQLSGGPRSIFPPLNFIFMAVIRCNKMCFHQVYTECLICYEMSRWRSKLQLWYYKFQQEHRVHSEWTQIADSVH